MFWCRVCPKFRKRPLTLSFPALGEGNNCGWGVQLLGSALLMGAANLEAGN